MKKKLSCWAVVLTLILAMLPATAAADSKLLAKVGDQTYANIQEAWDAVCENGGTIEMLTDWTISDHLSVSEGSSVTLEMHGHMIDCYNNSNSYAFKLEEDASLTINGGSEAEAREFSRVCFFVYRDFGDYSARILYTPRRKYSAFHEDKVLEQYLVSGGLIIGAIDDYGAINMDDGAKLTITGVTLAGNWTDDKGGSIYVGGDDCQVDLNDCSVCYNFAESEISIKIVYVDLDDRAYGAAIAVDGDDASITLKNTNVFENTAKEDGGAIYVNGDNCSLVLDNSSIYNNHSEDEGGAIFSNDNNKLGITLKNKSSIKDNSAEGDGGAIYVNSDNCSLALDNSSIYNNHSEVDGGAIFSNDNELDITLKNKSSIKDNSADGDGGAICYANTVDIDAAITMEKDCAISGNSAGDDGGAIYVGGEGLTIEGGEISNNICSSTDGLGGGIYFYNDRCTVTGTTIAGNSAYKGGAIYLDEMECTIKDCDIHGNTASDCGGGIYVEEDENTISGGSMYQNCAETSGGGIYFEMGDNTLSGVSVYKNTAKVDGGGIYLAAGDNTLSGVSVYENSAKFNGGGVLVKENVILFGVTDIHGNTVGTDSALGNLYMSMYRSGADEDNSSVIYGTPADGSTIGISAYDDGEHDSIQLTDDDAEHNISAYTSDSPDWHIEAGEDGQLYLKKGAGGLAGSVFGESSVGLLIAGIVIILGGVAACIVVAKKKKTAK